MVEEDWDSAKGRSSPALAAINSGTRHLIASSL